MQFPKVISLTHNSEKFETWHAGIAGRLWQGLGGWDRTLKFSARDLICLCTTVKGWCLFYCGVKVDRVNTPKKLITHSFSSADDPLVLCMLYCIASVYCIGWQLYSKADLTHRHRSVTILHNFDYWFICIICSFIHSFILWFDSVNRL